ncbi:MAG: hypothetical protein IPK19_05770 [Chloroflexi bacterium]|nr:hypothetical protein [Chloroflexota bacterium]
MPIDDHYDLTVIINVIEHCFDIDQVFQHSCRQRQVLRFSDKYYTHDEVSRTVEERYDAAHPLHVDRTLVDSFLDANFKALYRKVLDHHFTLDEIHLKWQEVVSSLVSESSLASLT